MTMTVPTKTPIKPNTEAVPVLIALDAPLKPRRWRLTEKELVIGRSEEHCDIVIRQRQVSRLHARLKVTEQGVLLEDLGSKNGTYVNGARITQARLLRDGDIITIAYAARFAFSQGEPTATLPLPEEAANADLPPAAPSDDRPRRLRLDPATRDVWIRGRLLQPPLSPAQFQLLQILYEHKGQVVSRATLIREIWGPQAVGLSSQALDALIHRLRERLAEADPDFAYLRTVRGQGLRLENPPDE